MERLTAGRLESQRLLVPMVLDVAAVGAAGAARPRRASSSASASRSKASARDDQGDGGAGAARAPRTARRRCCALAEDLEGLDRGAQVQDALQRIAATTACHAAVKANYPLTLREDDAHPRRAARDGVFDGLSARPAGDAAADAARDREELRSDLRAGGGRSAGRSAAERRCHDAGAVRSRQVLRTAVGEEHPLLRRPVAQLIGMWLLLVDLFTAGPLGPESEAVRGRRRGLSRRLGGDDARSSGHERTFACRFC